MEQKTIVATVASATRLRYEDLLLSRAYRDREKTIRESTLRTGGFASRSSFTEINRARGGKDRKVRTMIWSLTHRDACHCFPYLSCFILHRLVLPRSVVIDLYLSTCVVIFATSLSLASRSRFFHRGWIEMRFECGYLRLVRRQIFRLIAKRWRRVTFVTSYGIPILGEITPWWLALKIEHLRLTRIYA